MNKTKLFLLLVTNLNEFHKESGTSHEKCSYQLSEDDCQVPDNLSESEDRLLTDNNYISCRYTFQLPYVEDNHYCYLIVGTFPVEWVFVLLGKKF